LAPAMSPAVVRDGLVEGPVLSVVSRMLVVVT
jgi:hypothetical protein